MGGATSIAAPAVGLGFDGIGNGVYGYVVTSAPPDTNGAVGLNHYVEIVNQAFAVFDKSGNVKYGPVNTNTIWSGFGGGCETNNDGDGTVEYDKRADRFVIQQFSVTTTPYLECVAVSTTGDPTASYNRYSFGGFGSEFPDYPKLSVWPDAYYMTFNMFNSALTTFLGPKFCALERSKMLTGAAATQQCFEYANPNFGGDLASDMEGSIDPPVGSPNYIMGFETNSLDLWKFHVDWTTPANTTLTGPSSIAVNAFTLPCGNGRTCIPQLGTRQQLDSLGDRLMSRLSYRNFGSYESILATHSVGTPTGVRWYEIRNPGVSPTVYQQSTYAPDSTYRWMPSIAQDRNGDIAMEYSISSSSINPGISYTGRLASDLLNTMQTETSLFSGSGSQTRFLSRWGDYSSITVDPVDDCTFWIANEYIPSYGTFNWRTRIGSFSFPSCRNTQGNWVGAYGADGYDLLGWNGSSDLASLPKSNLVLDQGNRYLWNSSTTAVQALQSPDTSIRRAACFYDPSQLRLHLTFPSAYSGSLHVYSLDWDSTSRRENITVNDGSGPQTVSITSDFSQGAWVHVPINVPAVGSVTISVTPTAGQNAVLSGVFLGGPPPVPAAPTGLNASPISSSQINLSWSGSSGATNYKVQRSPDGSTGWTQIGTSSTTSFSDSGLSPSTTYFYRVLASNASADSTPSNVASATTKALISYSQSPQGNWVGSYGADGYDLLGWNGSSDLTSLPLSSLVLDQGNRYQWNASTTAVQALQSPDTSIRRAACFYDFSQLRVHLTFPAAYAGNLRLYAVDWDTTSRRETITVNDGSGPQTVNISTDFSQGAWVNVPINVPAGGSVTISVTPTAGQNAVLSGVFLGGPPPVPAAPTGLNASPISSSQINLSWSGSSGATNYKVQRSPDGSTGWTQIGTASTTSFSDSGLSPSTTYFYRVLASNGAADSAPSNVASATTKALIPYSQSPQGNWVGAYGADGYDLLGWNGSSDLASMPKASPVLDQGNRYLWNASTTAVQALQSPDTSTRRAACFYDASQLRFHLTFPAAYAGNLRLYAVDWDSTSRRETINVDDGHGPQTANISTDFSQGAWISIAINVPAGGSVTISVTPTAGQNAVLSGVFLG